MGSLRAKNASEKFSRLGTFNLPAKNRFHSLHLRISWILKLNVEHRVSNLDVYDKKTDEKHCDAKMSL
jgi:hypothetical protein